MQPAAAASGITRPAPWPQFPDSSPWLRWCTPRRVNGLLTAWWVLLAIPLAIRALPAGAARQPWPLAAELAAALACGAALAALSGGWLADFALQGGPLHSSDFHEYCDIVASLRDGVADNSSRQRSLLAALPSAVLSRRLGIVDGMAAAGLLSVALTGAGLYACGRALRGPLAGFATVAAGAALTPIVILSRTLSFYPEMIAVFTLSSAGALLAVRRRTLGALVACGVGAGLCFLIDARGLLWGLTAAGIGALAALCAPLPRWPARLAALLVPIWLAWFGGWLAYTEHAQSLQEQTAVARRIADRRGLDISLSLPAHPFVWGHSPVRNLPMELLALSTESAQIPAWMAEDAHASRQVRLHIRPLLPALAISGLALVLAERRRPLLLLAAGGAALPYLLSLRSAIQLGQLYTRYLSTAAVVAAVLLGAGFAALAGRGPLRAAAGAVVAFLIAIGSLYTPLSPAAPWREQLPAQRDDIVTAVFDAERGDTGTACARALAEDQQRGLPVGGRLHGGIHITEDERAYFAVHGHLP